MKSIVLRVQERIKNLREWIPTMKKNKFYLLLLMMIFLFSGCMRNDRNTITSEETESTITSDSTSSKAIDNESKKESTEESAVQLSDFINPEGNTLFTRFITPEGYIRLNLTVHLCITLIKEKRAETVTPQYFLWKWRKKTCNSAQTVL